jgi:hypothetical protein
MELVVDDGATLHLPAGVSAGITVNSNLTCSQANITVAHDFVLELGSS